ncbi:collagen-like protein [Pseudomonas schmalbachii]|uniref:Collagen-like protein n=1 Tax=Pseudomonas schmalbachii TaxID=2816993 RepID=A0ABS3TUJ8_9PSED|nr:collagen-like protein [Pseudomonas schmalbachii]MBO3276360.1 collagen-like protein [Pseudomonas schmalbachii]
MRKALAGLALLMPLACLAAESIQVEANTVLRLPAKSESLSLDRVTVAEQGALLIPARVKVLRIEHLQLGKNARLGVFPNQEPLRIEVLDGQLADGSVIAAQGASGSFQKPASAGRNLVLHLQNVDVTNLLVDVRGGVGAPGFDGLDGADARAGGCLWGSSQAAGDGQNGGDGQPGAAGGVVRLEVPQGFPVELVKVRLEGGVGGAPGKPGKGGARSGERGCLIYSQSGGVGGQPGQPGAAGAAGTAGRLEVQNF